MRVRVNDGLVVEIIPPGATYHPEIEASIVEAPEGVLPGWAYEDGEFTAPAQPSLMDRCNAVYASLSMQYEQFLTKTRGYTPGWLAKAKQIQDQAKEVLADPGSSPEQTSAAQQLLDLLASLDAWENGISDYYVDKSNEIMASGEPEAVSWDFERFAAADPGITLPWHLLPLSKIMKGQAG